MLGLHLTFLGYPVVMITIATPQTWRAQSQLQPLVEPQLRHL